MEWEAKMRDIGEVVGWLDYLAKCGAKRQEAAVLRDEAVVLEGELNEARDEVAGSRDEGRLVAVARYNALLSRSLNLQMLARGLA